MKILIWSILNASAGGRKNAKILNSKEKLFLVKSVVEDYIPVYRYRSIVLYHQHNHRGLTSNWSSSKIEIHHDRCVNWGDSLSAACWREMKSEKNGGGIVPMFNSPRIWLVYVLYFLMSCLKKKKKKGKERKESVGCRLWCNQECFCMEELKTKPPSKRTPARG